MADVRPLGKMMNYIDALMTAEAAGGRLPSNAQVDEELLSGAWKNAAGYYASGIWTRTWVVHPPADGVFENGKDVIDSYHDISGRKCRLAARHVPKEAFGKKGVVLVAELASLREDKEHIEIIPKSVRLLNGFLQASGVGSADRETRIPTAMAGEVPDEQKRWLYRVEGVGVRPVVRGFNLKRGILLCLRNDAALGVGVVRE